MPNKLSHRKKSRKHNSRRTKKYNRKLKGGAGAAVVIGTNHKEYHVPFEHISPTPEQELPEIVDAEGFNNANEPGHIVTNPTEQVRPPTVAELLERGSSATKATAQNRIQLPTGEVMIRAPNDVYTMSRNEYMRRRYNSKTIANKKVAEAAAEAEHPYERIPGKHKLPLESNL